MSVMKADATGTPCEQSRARMGWKGSAERKAAGANPVMVCANCHFSELRRTSMLRGVASVALRCVHRDAWGGYGMATKPAAGCDRWEERRT